MVGMDQYKDLAERMKLNEMDADTNDSHSNDGGIDSRATLVPQGAGFPTLQVSTVYWLIQQSGRERLLT